MVVSVAWIKRARVLLAALCFSLLLSAAVFYVLNDQAKQDRDQARRDREQTRLTTRSHNSIVCVTRPYIQGSRDRSAKAALDKGTTKAARARARAGVVASDQFLAGLVTIPRNFNCKPLLARLLKEAEHDEH